MLGIMTNDFLGIMRVVPGTLAMTAVIFILSTLLGAVMTLIEQYKVPILAQLVIVFKLFLKGTPMVIYIFLTYFTFPIIVGFFTKLIGSNFDPQTISPIITIVVALTCTLAPFQSEIIKGAFLSVNYGQIEAAYSLGYSFIQTFCRVIVPQAFLAAIPDLTNSVMVILKALSLAFVITVVDIFAKAQLLAALDFHYLEAFFMAALIYWIISIILTKISDKYEQRMRSRV